MSRLSQPPACCRAASPGSLSYARAVSLLMSLTVRVPERQHHRCHLPARTPGQLSPAPCLWCVPELEGTRCVISPKHSTASPGASHFCSQRIGPTNLSGPCVIPKGGWSSEICRLLHGASHLPPLLFRHRWNKFQPLLLAFPGAGLFLVACQELGFLGVFTLRAIGGALSRWDGVSWDKISPSQGLVLEKASHLLLTSRLGLGAPSSGWDLD